MRIPDIIFRSLPCRNGPTSVDPPRRALGDSFEVAKPIYPGLVDDSAMLGDVICRNNDPRKVGQDEGLTYGILLTVAVLSREAQVNIAIRWFVGYGLHEELPDHSSVTRIRQRWGEERFRTIFKRTVEACLRAKIAMAEIVHIDASLIRTNVSWESLVERHVEDVLTKNRTDEEIDVERQDRQSGKYKKVCTTDPDATMATSARNRRLEPAYKQHTAVDDKIGVILDVEVTTAQTNEREMIETQVNEVEATKATTSTSSRASSSPPAARAHDAGH
jgi:IS5 family transposase